MTKEPLYELDAATAAASQLSDFARFAERATGLTFVDYASLHGFSIGEPDRFWTLFLEWTGALVDGSSEPATSGSGVMETQFFPALRLSWPENVLAQRAPPEEEAVAIVSLDEDGTRDEISRCDLRARVRAAAAGLEEMGLGEGDRVVAIVRNTVDTVVACLAVTSLGATWSSLSIEMGREAAVARLALLAPKMLLFHGFTRQNGVLIRPPIEDIVRELPTLCHLVRLDGGYPEAPDPASASTLPLTTLARLEAGGRARPAELIGPWRRFAFDHPLFVLFSSGTTGPPKGIVHGHGGTLLEHLKEHRLHGDLGPKDTLCFNTSTGWMMWNWTVSALAAGARIVLYDGSVSHPTRDALLRCISAERVTVFGLSPAYLQYVIDAGLDATRERMRRLRTILSTGSVLPSHLHRWAKESFADAPVESISGGTDILGCFVLGSPWTPTFEGESSSIGLGLDVRAWVDGRPSKQGAGELVCVAPFPSRPVAFVADADGKRRYDTYFAQHPGAWTHGDLVELSPRGTVRVLGRCDGVMNIRGIRIGPAEIYDIVSSAFPEVAQAMAVDADAPEEPGAKRLVLLLVLRSGALLDRGLKLRIKKALKEGASPAHVPSAIVAVSELPMTFNNKLSERAMQDALSGRPVRNLAALRNPAAIWKAVQALQFAQT